MANIFHPNAKTHLLLLAFLIISAAPPFATASKLDSLITCFIQNEVTNFTTPSSIYPSAFTSLLDFSIHNLRFQGSTPQPDAIVLPSSAHELQRAFNCCCSSSVKDRWVLRVRGGGHSYEGLSYTADKPFVLVDLMNIRSIDIDMTTESAWVQAGATLGEFYYAISRASSLHSFPAGSCPTVGVGGHISGGGYGFLSRKYGVAADNVIDAQVLDASGRLLNNRSEMGEDLFWALRGGGGGSWGIVLAWKLKLVPVPAVVTTLSLTNSLKNKSSIISLLRRWQTGAAAAPDELYHSVKLSGGENQTIVGSMSGLYLGNISSAIAIVQDLYPELNVTADIEFEEKSWIEAAVEEAEEPEVVTPADMANRVKGGGKSFFKAKSDYVREAIGDGALEGMIEILMQNPKGFIIMDPYGGQTSRKNSSDIAFPHRAGNLYSIQYLISWDPNVAGDELASLTWLDVFYGYMASYVSSDPRAAYINYIDLDLGGPLEAGPRYFLDNFPRLLHIKAMVDPLNIFNNSQSIPLVPGAFR